MLEWQRAVMEFAEAVLHGDGEHRAWLMEAAEAFIVKRPLPPPRGKGTSVGLGEWLPIETAPKDGSAAWLHDPLANEYHPLGCQQVGRWNSRLREPHWEMVDPQTGEICGASPTHWMPLPSPPKS